MCPEEERAATRPHFPHRLRIAATTYALPAGTDMAAYENLPGHHLLSIWNLIATTNNESYRSSAGETPPATLHGHVKWDFSDVPDPVTFR
jgi:hypothetical protein